MDPSSASGSTTLSSPPPAAPPPSPAPRPIKTEDGHYIVRLNVYDVTNTPSEDTNGLVVKINNVTHQLGIGGVFHGGIEVDSVEWSYGYCDSGTGVYHCAPTQNPMYSLRATVELGHTVMTKTQIRDLLSRLRKEWPGDAYTLLSRNCCHFCDAFARELGAEPIPTWLNRFAQSADATISFTNEAMEMARAVGSSVSRTANWFRDSVTKMWSGDGSAPGACSPGAASDRQDCLPGLHGYTSASSSASSSRPQSTPGGAWGGSAGGLSRFAFFPPQSAPSEGGLLDAEVAGALAARGESGSGGASRAPLQVAMSGGPGGGAGGGGGGGMSADLLAQSAAAAASARAAAAAHQSKPSPSHLLDS